MKSLMLFGGQIMKENERQTRAAVEKSFDGIGKVFKSSIRKRLHHHLHKGGARPSLTPTTSEVQSVPEYIGASKKEIKADLIAM